MMYSTLPPRSAIIIRITLTVAWVLIACGGGSAILFTPNTIVSELGLVVTFVWGATVFVTGLVAAAGVAFDKYRLEWIPAWFAFAGAMPYCITVWWLVSSGELTRLTQAFLVSSLLVFMMLRAMFCGAHAAKQRVLHATETGIIDVLP